MLIRNKERYPKVTRNQMSFEEWFSLAENYYKEHGNLLVPLKYVTPTGEKLGIWIVNNRKRYADGLLLPDRVRALNSIGMFWSIHEKNWQDMYTALLEYQSIHGDLNVPSKYVTENGKPLGRWLIYQTVLHFKGTLSREHEEKLESIGVIWRTNDAKWAFMYKLATEYQKEYGNLNIPQNYTASDDQALGIWLQTQRNNYRDGKLKPERIKLLEDIGINWHPKQCYSWKKMYTLAAEYYNTNGNLAIPRSYKAPNGANLGTWLSSQRQKYRQGKLAKEKTLALENIGVVWDFKIDNGISHYLKKLKEEGIIIDEEINKDILNHISLIELQSKVKYITDRGALPVDKDGHLIDIFSMASTDIEAKYGISLEALIEAFEVENTRKLYY